MRWPGIEPGSNAWKASMLTITPPTLIIRSPKIFYILYDPDKTHLISFGVEKIWNFLIFICIKFSFELTVHFFGFFPFNSPIVVNFY